jgi:hypothetical protein
VRDATGVTEPVPVGRSPSRAASAVAGIGLVALLILLLPFAIVTVIVLVIVWPAGLGALAATAVAILLDRARRRSAIFLAIALVAGIVAWIGAIAMSEWDLEGQQGEQPWGAAEVAVAGGAVALVFGLAAALRSRRWGVRYGGVALATVGALAASGMAFL